MQIPHLVEEDFEKLDKIIPKTYCHAKETHLKFFYNKAHYLS